MLEVVWGDLLDQDVEVIVNAWNRNIIPWWLLLPLGGAVETGSGRLPFKAIIHVAGINMFWHPSEYSIRQSVKNALTLALARRRRFAPIASPLIGTGVGSCLPEKVMGFMEEEVANSCYGGEVRIVRFTNKS